ncbi:MAG: CPBP family intramembrane metalloprotease [Gemmatimonadetes bacterium]|nr:CPBP family intramembrane metalloprotease [Gemmatimonadota bacterium]NIR79998.1 CPBP family intramembrane metalloprotease [Gemmatimonadota bacterium]NIT85453.1 CPBP family intramembrane metalloprotease [Gemmatimonadota bacterium]NIU32543.1 CPBP family intramembrane metalloprotease [Gemmatimonadota bacterium]NIU37006.1 CPBP family intramembrane metalloprotease [Gemmatimonadota bacterium]
MDRSEGPGRPGPELPPEMGRFLRRGILLYPVAVVGIWALTDLGAWNALFLASLLELLPVLAVVQVPLAADQELDRPSAYVGSAGAVLILGWLSLLLGERSVGLEAMGLEVVGWKPFLVGAGVGLAGGLGLTGGFHLWQTWTGREESEFLRKLLPRSAFEKTLFVGVSFSAGLGEELAYRAYAIPVLAGLLGTDWGAAVLSSGIFGLLHAYQGQIGVVRTGLMGLVLAGVFLVSGSVWPAVAAHVLIDLVGGLVLGPRLLEDA